GGYDFGLDHLGIVGDFVWNDASNTGTVDPGELGIPGVTVELYAPDGITLLAVTLTDPDGAYSFPGLADGPYVVKVLASSIPGGFVQTYDNSGATTDNTGWATVGSSGSDLTADFGYTNPASYNVSGTVWNDNGGTTGTPSDGIQNGDEAGIPGMNVNLVILAVIDGQIDINGDGVITVDDDGSYGGYTVTDGVLAAGAIGQTLNGMPVLDNGSGLGVLDVDSNGVVDGSDDQASTVFASNVTDANGDYNFTGVPDGDYLIQVDTDTLPSAAYVQTGDPDSVLDSKHAVTVNGADVLNKDFGYEENLGSITGSVCDGDGNGLCDGGDIVLSGVTVYLTFAGSDGILGTADDVVQSQITDGSGNYTFADLPTGIYQITKTNPADKVDLADADGGNPNNIRLVPF
ncbi:MAG: hypothetical protein D3924_18775, partial [Candidatus Electrothrix sp. AR4]|nr:hypothetical protein [Candidatus Electrothrix sp. AR4]